MVPKLNLEIQSRNSYINFLTSFDLFPFTFSEDKSALLILVRYNYIRNTKENIKNSSKKVCCNYYFSHTKSRIHLKFFNFKVPLFFV